MLEKQQVIEALEKERQFALEVDEPKMALGLGQAITVVRRLPEKRKNIVTVDKFTEVE